jgi:hypothetical protein
MKKMAIVVDEMETDINETESNQTQNNPLIQPLHTQWCIAKWGTATG